MRTCPEATDTVALRVGMAGTEQQRSSGAVEEITDQAKEKGPEIHSKKIQEFEELLKVYGRWCRTPRPKPNGYVALERCTFHFPAAGAPMQVESTPLNDCYVYIAVGPSCSFSPKIVRLTLFIIFGNPPP